MCRDFFFECDLNFVKYFFHARLVTPNPECSYPTPNVNMNLPLI
jgi:hypothetical protein